MSKPAPERRGTAPSNAFSTAFFWDDYALALTVGEHLARNPPALAHLLEAAGGGFLDVAESLLRSPASLALLLAAAGPTVLRRAGTLLARSTAGRSAAPDLDDVMAQSTGRPPAEWLHTHATYLKDSCAALPPFLVRDRRRRKGEPAGSVPAKEPN